MPDVQKRDNSHKSSRPLWKKRCVLEGVVNDAVALFFIVSLAHTITWVNLFASFGFLQFWRFPPKLMEQLEESYLKGC